MKRFTYLILSLTALSSPMMAESVLDVKHTLTDQNVVPPEAYEIKSQQIEDNYYLLNCIAKDDQVPDKVVKGTPEQYELGLKALPTIIELPYNPLVGKFIDMYLTKPGYLSNMLALHNYYGPIFMGELLKQDLPTELQYLPVVESSLNPNAVSKSGAAGLWQFIPETALGLGMEVNSLVDQRRDPQLSSQYAATYLKQLYDVYNDWTLALAAYNCGMGNVNKALRRAGEGKKDFWEIYNYLPQEARGYVPAYIAVCYVMNHYKNHGVRPTVVKRRLTTDTVMVNEYIHFDQIADILGVPSDELRLLNPQFREDVIPGDFHPYALTLPKQQCLSYVMSSDKIAQHNADKYVRRSKAEPLVINEQAQDLAQNTSSSATQEVPQPAPKVIAAQTPVPLPSGKKVRKTHVVARGESIRDIAHAYNVSATDIKLWNDLRRGKVKEGDELIIEVNETQEVAQVPPAVQQTQPEPVKAVETKTTQPETTTQKAESAKASKPAKAATTKKSKTRARKAQPKTTNHEVKSGDSLERIAKQHGVTVDELRAANGMKANQDMIHPGDKIKVPTAKSSKKSSSKKGKTTKKSSRKKRRR